MKETKISQKLLNIEYFIKFCSCAMFPLHFYCTLFSHTHTTSQMCVQSETEKKTCFWFSVGCFFPLFRFLWPFFYFHFFFGFCFCFCMLFGVWFLFIVPWLGAFLFIYISFYFRLSGRVTFFSSLWVKTHIINAAVRVCAVCCFAAQKVVVSNLFLFLK